MGTKPVHAVLGLVVLSGALASGCRSTSSDGGSSPGLVGSNTPSNNTPTAGAFGRDPGGVANAPSSLKPATNGQSAANFYNNPSTPTLASSAASPGGIKEYPNNVNVADNGTVTAGRSMGWNSSPRSNTVVPGGTYTSGAPAPGDNPYPSATAGAGMSSGTSAGVTPGMSSGTSAGLAPVSYQPPPPPGAVASPYPNPNPATFPSQGRDSFKEQPAMAGTTMPTSGGNTTMTFAPAGGTSGDVGRSPTPAPQVAACPARRFPHASERHGARASSRIEVA